MLMGIIRRAFRAIFYQRIKVYIPVMVEDEMKRGMAIKKIRMRGMPSKGMVLFLKGVGEVVVRKLKFDETQENDTSVTTSPKTFHNRKELEKMQESKWWVFCNSSCK